MSNHLLWLLVCLSLSTHTHAERIPCARILFIHVPKTGGESVKATLRKSFPLFNFLDHRSYDWRSLTKKKLRRGRKRREISTSSTMSRAKPLETFGEIYQDCKVRGRKRSAFIFPLWLFARVRNSRLVRILTVVALVL